MRILLTASEAVPFAKTGGLADVTSALARSFAESGHDVTLVLPDYPRLRSGKNLRGITIEQTGKTVEIPINNRKIKGSLLRARQNGNKADVILVSRPEFFDRDGLYGDKHGDFQDNCERFCFFSRAVMETARLLDLRPDVIHANDWQTGLVPALLDVEYRGVPSFARTASVITIHNLAFQGVFPSFDMPLTGLDWKYFNWEQMEFYDQLNLLKTGLVFADAITTVSPTYAKEIQTEEFGCGLAPVLRHRCDDLTGILNGIDPDEWNPATDSHLPTRYSADDWYRPDRKPACKELLQQLSNLPLKPDIPLFGTVSRLTDQKGVDLFLAGLNELIDTGAQFVVLGTGDPHIEDALRAAATAHPRQLAVTIGFDESLAHKIEAGADAFLMPSRFEPCGLNQMYSLRYGTVPVVRAVGGLADSVTDATPANLATGAANGFSFKEYTPEAFVDSVRRAVRTYQQSAVWKQLVNTGMNQDWSWPKRTKEYVAVYEQALAKRT